MESNYELHLSGEVINRHFLRQAQLLIHNLPAGINARFEMHK